MEIERKYIIHTPPADLEERPCRHIEQAYISRDPVIRVRRSDDRYILTVKGRGLVAREEFELELSEESYAKLIKKAEGNIIRKTRYLIPFGPYTIETDVFKEPFDDLILAEVEFPSLEEAEAFAPPDWFGEDVTDDPRFQNASMSAEDFPDRSFFSVRA